MAEGVHRPGRARRADVEVVANPLVALDELVHHAEQIDVRLVRHHLRGKSRQIKKLASYTKARIAHLPH